MFQLVVVDQYGYTIQHLSQWDKNLVLYIKNWGYDTLPSIHFFNRNMKNALVVSSKLVGENLIKVSVPNVMLETPCPIVMCAYLEEYDGLSRTVFTYEIPVRPRAKPDDYEYSGDNDDNGNVIDTSTNLAAVESDIAYGKIAYANGEKLVGVLSQINQVESQATSVVQEGTDEIRLHIKPFEHKAIVDATTNIDVFAKLSEFGDARPEDVRNGVIFTSSSGLLAKGTHVCESGTDTSDATAEEEHILDGKTAYSKGRFITGTIPNRDVTDISVIGAQVSIPSGHYASTETVQISSAEQAAPSISVDSAGKITASATQTAGYVSSGTKSATRQLTTQAAQTITPGNTDQTIASGRYLTGTQTIKGDANLLPEYIVKGVSIFGVAGSHTCDSGINTFDATAEAGHIMKDKTAYVKGKLVIGTHECDSSEGSNLEVEDLSELHYWKKYTFEGGTLVLGTGTEVDIASWINQGANVSQTIEYADKAEIQNGAVVLVNAQSVTYLQSDYDTDVKFLKGKYVKESSSGKIYYLPDAANVYWYQNTSYMNYTAIKCPSAQEVSISGGNGVNTEVVCVVSTDRSAYPQNGTQNGYLYVYEGTLNTTSGVDTSDATVTATDILKDKIAYGAAGTPIKGTHECNNTGTGGDVAMASGVATIDAPCDSFTIETGLNTLDTIIVSTTQPETQSGTWYWARSKAGDVTNYVSYSSIPFRYGYNVSKMIDNGDGSVTVNQYSSSYPILTGTYNWIAYGKGV